MNAGIVLYSKILGRKLTRKEYDNYRKGYLIGSAISVAIIIIIAVVILL